MKRTGDPADMRLIVIFLRSLRKWNQVELATAARVDKGLISDYELGLKTPSRGNLDRILAAVRLPYAVVERLLPIFRAVRLALEKSLSLGDNGIPKSLTLDLTQAAGEAVLAGVAPALLEIPALGGMEPEEAPLSPAEARRHAAELWQTVVDLPHKRRKTVLAVAKEYHTWAMSELLCEKSAEWAAGRAGDARELAELALAVAGKVPVPGPEGCRIRLQGYCWGFVGNARRVCGDLPAADEAFLLSSGLWDKGEPSALWPLDGARLLDLESSLRRHQERYSEALALLDEALAAYPKRDPHRGRLLLKKAFTLEQQGICAKALEVLEEAAAELTGNSIAPRLLFALQFNRAVLLYHLGHYAEAEALLPEIWSRTEALDNELDAVRTLWLEGRLAAALGRSAEAVEALGKVREEFALRQIALDTALATLELAELYLEEGRNSEVRGLAQEMLWIFKSQQVKQKTLSSLKLFCDAAEREAATVEMVRRLAAELRRGL